MREEEGGKGKRGQEGGRKEGRKVYFCEFVKRCAITRLRERAARSGDLVLCSTGTTAACFTFCFSKIR